jgi:hypothetical protein
MVALKRGRGSFADALIGELGARAFSQFTLDQIRKAGFLYDSSFMAIDEPYELVPTDRRPE